MGAVSEQLFGRDRDELELELDETRDTLRELHSLTRSIVGAQSELERRAWRALEVVTELARTVASRELDGRLRGSLTPSERMRASRLAVRPPRDEDAAT
jgi:hypothetical protein